MNSFLTDILVNDWFQMLSTIGLVIAWIVDRRKRKVDYNSSRVSVLDNIENLYDSFSERFKREYSTLSDKIQSLEIALKEANINRESLLKRIEEFEEQSRSDKFLISELTTKVDKQQETIDIQRLKISQLERRQV